jgi:PAS domain S-box-containing protein
VPVTTPAEDRLRGILAALFDRSPAGRARRREPAGGARAAGERESEARYAALAESAPVGIYRVDERGRAVYANRRASELTGVPVERLLGAGFLEAIHADDRAQLMDDHRAARLEGRAYQTEFRIVRADGSTVWAALQAAPEAGSQGRFYVGTLTDISKHKRTEQALLASQRFTQRLAEISPVGIYRLDLDGHATWVNERLCEIAGTSLDEAISDAWRAKLATPDDPALARVRVAMERGEPFAEEFAFARADGSVAWALSQGEPDRDEAGRLVAYVGTLTDVSELKRAEHEVARHRDRLGELVVARTAELERTHAKLRESERLAAVGTFAAGIAHQINNPVGGILLAAQFAQEQSGDPAALAMALEHIVADARRCGRIVRGVLEFARGDDGERHPCDLNQIAKVVLAEVADEVAERGAEVALELAPGLPKVLASGAALDQVVHNLLENALDAGAHRVELRTGLDAEAVVLEVRDDGRGIPPDDLSRVVDPFFTTRRGRGGTGLGLSLAYGIVRGHGGTLELASAVGRGTTVTVRLPSGGGAMA